MPQASLPRGSLIEDYRSVFLMQLLQQCASHMLIAACRRPRCRDHVCTDATAVQRGTDVEFTVAIPINAPDVCQGRGFYVAKFKPNRH